MAILVGKFINIPGQGTVHGLFDGKLVEDCEPVPVRLFRGEHHTPTMNFKNSIGSRSAVWNDTYDPWGDEWRLRHSRRGAGFGKPQKTWKERRNWLGRRKSRWNEPALPVRLISPHLAEIEAVIHGTDI